MTDSAREHLEAVQAELDEAAAEGHEDAADLAGHVGAYLGLEQPSEEDHADLVQRLREGARRFEIAHPRLSHTMQGVIDSLTASGI